MELKLTTRLEELIREAVARDASDLFLIPGEPPAMRLRGLIERTDADALAAEDVREMASAAVGEANLKRVGPELGTYKRWFGVAAECNVGICVARSHGDYTMTLRIMPTLIFTVEDMRFPEAMVKAALSPNGLVIVAGRVGSGKTTGLIGLVDHINATVDGCHICTVEGPSHMAIPAKKALVQQREVGVDAPSTLAGIEAAASQDLDVLMIGEIATVEELQAAITMAETGHLVLTQVHADSPEAAIQRMIDVFPEDIRAVSRKALAHVLRGVSAQRLMPTADGKTRVAAYGVLIPDDEMREAIAEGRDFMARKTPWPEGCQTMAEHIQQLLAEGTIDEATAKRVLAQGNRT